MTDLDSVKAGKYELVVHQWRQVTSKPGEPFDFVTRRKGDVVELDVEQARRLVAAGAVKPASKKAEKTDDGSGSDPGDTGAKPTTVDAILAAVGDDKARAQEYLDAENAADKPRVTLVEKLQAIIDAEA